MIVDTGSTDSTEKIARKLCDDYGFIYYMTEEKYNEMIDSINNECKDFCEFKDEFLEASLIPERNR